MGLLTGLSLAILGVLATPQMLLSKKPNAAGMLDKIIPYQGWLGAVCAMWGAWGVVNAFLNMRGIESFPVWWFTALSASLLEVVLGVLLGVGVLTSFIKAPQARARLDKLVAKLAPSQGLVGIIAIGIGAWCIVANVVYA
jgi:hypothetical protein